MVVTVNATPIHWSRSHEELEPSPATLVPWPGFAQRPGAFVVSRINLNHINATCTKFAQTLKTAASITKTLHDTKLRHATHNQLIRYGYMLVRTEMELKDTLDYLTDLVLCDGRGGEMWGNFKAFRDESSVAWNLLRAAGIKQSPSSLNNKNNMRGASDNSTTLANITRSTTGSQKNNSILEILQENRPKFGGRQPKALFMAGATLGLLGGVLVSKIFGANNAEEINTINRNINKNNKNLKITNERIDILAKNISKSNELIKNI